MNMAPSANKKRRAEEASSDDDNDDVGTEEDMGSGDDCEDEDDDDEDEEDEDQEESEDVEWERSAVIPALVGQLQAAQDSSTNDNNQDAVVAELLSGLIDSLVKDPSAALTVGLAGGIPPIIKTIQSHTSIACRLLKRMCENKKIKVTLVRFGAISEIFAALSKRKDDDFVLLEHALGTLTALAWVGGLVIKEVQLERLIAVSLISMKKYPMEARIQCAACQLLGELANDIDVDESESTNQAKRKKSVQASIIKAGTVKAAIVAMKNHGENATVQAAAMMLMMQLGVAKSPASVNAFAEAGGISLLTQALVNHQTDETVFVNGCSIINFIMANSYDQYRAVLATQAPILLRVIAQGSTNSKDPHTQMLAQGTASALQFVQKNHSA